MPRRTRVLLFLLVVSAAALGAWIATSGLPPQYYALKRRFEPVRVPWEARIEDPTGALAIARSSVLEQIGRFERDLGIDLRILVHRSAAAGGATGDERVAQLLDERDVGDGFGTGGIVVAIDLSSREVLAAASDEIAALVAAAFPERVAARSAPWLGHPYAGIALASGLAALADDLLEHARRGDLDVEEPGSLLELVRGGEAQATGCSAAPAPAADPSASVEAFRCLLLAEHGAAESPLLTPESRVHLARAPLGAFASHARAAGLEAGRPWTVSVSGDRAAVRSVRPEGDTREFPPVLLVRDQGVWRVDLVEMGKAFRRGPTGIWRSWNLAGPYWLVLGTEHAPQREALTPVELWGEPLEDAIARLEASDVPAARVRLAELLLRNAWLPGEALARWDEALSVADPDAALTRRFADRAEYLDLPLLAAQALAPLGSSDATRVAELLLRGGRIDEGKLLLQGALSERARRREADGMAPEPMPVPQGPSI